jgi:hypothetical protein
LNYPNVIRNYNAVTAACLLMRRALFLNVGGFDEERFPVSYNDVDLCLRLRQQGYQVVYTPYAQLYHHESATRGTNRYPSEEACLRARWANELISDSYYNPNLDANGGFSVDYSKPEAMILALAQNRSEQVVGQLNDATRIGQEFVITHDNLCAIAVRLQPTRHLGGGVLRLGVRESPASDSDLGVAEIEVAQAGDDDWCWFYFHPLRHSSGRRYYFYLEMSGTSSGSTINVWGCANGDAAAGQYFVNHLAVEGTLALRVYTLRQFRYPAFSATPHVASSQ